MRCSKGPAAHLYNGGSQERDEFIIVRVFVLIRVGVHPAETCTGRHRECPAMLKASDYKGFMGSI